MTSPQLTTLVVVVAGAGPGGGQALTPIIMSVRQLECLECQVLNIIDLIRHGAVYQGNRASIGRVFRVGPREKEVTHILTSS